MNITRWVHRYLSWVPVLFSLQFLQHIRIDQKEGKQTQKTCLSDYFACCPKRREGITILQKAGLTPAILLMLAALCGAPGAAFGTYRAVTGTVSNAFSIEAPIVCDESGDILEPRWDASSLRDRNGNGTPDVCELAPGSTAVKDPSIKNHQSFQAYAYLLVRIPRVTGRVKGDASALRIDAAIPQYESTWSAIYHETVSGDTASLYLFRYKEILAPDGRSAELFRTIRIPDWVEAEAFEGNLSITGLLMPSEGITPEAADSTALTLFRDKGLIGGS